MKVLQSVPQWFWVIAFAWAYYQGTRGVIEHEVLGTYTHYRCGGIECRDRPVSAWHRFLLVKLHDFAFRFICTIAGFVALAIAIHLSVTAEPGKTEWTALAALLAIAIPGVGGQLHWLILLGNKTA